MQRLARFFHSMQRPFRTYASDLLIKENHYLKEWIREAAPPERRSLYVVSAHTERFADLSSGRELASPYYLLCVSSREVEAKELAASLFGSDPRAWIPLFSHPRYKVFEYSDSHGHASSLSLIRDETMRKLSTYARELLHAEVDASHVPTAPTLDAEEKLACYVDTTFWLDGRVRGSFIIYSKDALRDIPRAVRASFNDIRFQRITPQDLKRVRIEITCIHPLGMPIHFEDRQYELLRHDKTYRMEREGKAGWYLPAAFAGADFSGLRRLLASLSLEKLGLPFKASSLEHTLLHETVSWIENEQHDSVLRLDGTLPQVSPSEEECISGMLGYLRSVQREDGSFPVIFNPRTGACYEDVPRMAFTIYATALYGHAKRDGRAILIADKGLGYLTTQMRGEPSHPLIPVYTALALVVSGQAEASERLIEKMLPSLLSRSHDPITSSQLAKLLLLSKLPRYQETAARIIEGVHADFMEKREKKREVSLPLYAELPWLLHAVGDETRAREVAEWYLSLQTERGSFPAGSKDPAGNVRGIAKVLEVLAQLPWIDRARVRRGMEWCARFQYTPDSLYMIPERAGLVARGGIRHDYSNPEVWTDAIGHMLIAYSA